MYKKIEINPTVYITGAGPEDPDLLTSKAKEIMEKANVIAYDILYPGKLTHMEQASKFFARAQ